MSSNSCLQDDILEVKNVIEVSHRSIEEYVEDHDLSELGYKAELERRFGLWSMVGLSCTIMVTWEGWFTTFGVNLADGGQAGSVYGFLFCWLGYTAVVASLAELVSWMPTAAGQYHWAYALASPKYRKAVSWITAWQVVVAWQADLAAVFYLCGSIIQGLVVLNYPDYGFERWHGTVIVWGIILIACVFNTILVRWLPWCEGGILIIHVLGFVVFLVPLLYFGPHGTAHDVFTLFQALGGYSPGLSWFVGLITTVFAFIGADGAIHMSEEVKNARVVVPKALMFSVTINGVLGFGMVIAVMFTIGNIQTALMPTTGFVFIDYFAAALRSKRFATGFTAVLLFLFIFTCIALVASTSRVTWALARDDGLPGSSWIKKVSASHLPLNSIFLSAFISVLLSLINIGSAVAFNAMVSLVVAAYFGSYAVPISMLAWKRLKGQHLQLGPWNMGSWGLYVNLFSLVWLASTWFFSFFPIAIPVTLQTMNWSCVLWGGVMLSGCLWYRFYQRHHFTGPAVASGILNVC